ncbi:hypothetical protein [Fusobacterium sp. SYSU M8D902]|uniref:hypothetical protein n=1 Tax=Fusobacterium sp. SYSU M8D902 TaxID=3159562 RepID=UPI0032E4231E
MTDIQYFKMTAKEKEKYFTNMSEIEKYEDLKERNKKYLTDEEKLFLLKMEVTLYENKVKEKKENNKNYWAKNILKPIMEILKEMYMKKYSEFTDNSNLDEKISAYLIQILQDENLEYKLENIKEEEYVFKNYKNVITRISDKRVRKNQNQQMEVNENE